MSNFEFYLGVEDLGGPRFHPEKNTLTFTYDAPGIYQVYTTDITPDKKRWAQRMSFYANRCTAPRYLSDGSIVFLTDDGGDENFQICIIDNHQQFVLTDDKAAKHNISFTSENYLYFSSNRDDKSKFEIYRWKIPLLDNEPEKLFTPKEGTVGVSYVNKDDTLVIIGNYLSNTNRNLILLEGQKNITEKYGRALWEVVRLLDDNTLLVLTNYESNFYRPAKLTLDGEFSTYSEVEKLEVMFEEYAFKEDSPFTYLVQNKDGYSALFRAEFSIDKAYLREFMLPIKGVFPRADQRRYTNALSLNHDGTLLAISISSSVSPANIHIMRLDDGKTWQATSSSHAGIDPRSFSNSSLHRFNSFDGLNVPYFKYIPSTSRPESGYPTIFVIHGGPESQYRPAFSPTVQFFLSAGFAVIAPNIRGSNGYGKKYLDLDNVEKRLDSIKDIQSLALHLQNDADLDHNRFIIYGGSYGGFAVLSAMTEFPDLWIGGVDIFGISNFVTFLENTAPWRRKLRESEYGRLVEDREILEKISPIHKIDRIKAPLFIIQGDNDERVPLSESQQMYDKLVERGIPVEFLRFPNEGHGITYLENKMKAYPAILDWIMKL